MRFRASWARGSAPLHAVTSCKECVARNARNIGLRPVRPADMLSAVRVSAGCKPAGHTDYKSMFQFRVISARRAVVEPKAGASTGP
jgi:hypothetical protein